jgi:DNA-binding protein HU-beta
MNKSELIASVAEETGLTRKDTERVLNTALDVIAAILADHEKVQLSGFGTFELKYREARVGRNLRTKEPTEIPAAWVPAFKPSKALREQVDREKE